MATAQGAPYQSIQVAREARDILLKYIARGLRKGLLNALHLSLSDIEEVLPADVPLLEVHAEYPDLLFRLKDGRILHIEFQTDRVPNLRRFWRYHAAAAIFYDTIVYSVVVYGRGIRRAPGALDRGFYPFKVHNIYLGKQDGEEVLARLRDRVETGEELDEAARIELMLLPLMAVKRPLVEVIEDVARLADRLPKVQRDEVIGTVIGLAYATIKASDARRLLEVLRMAHPIEEFVADLLLRGREEGWEDGRVAGREEGQVAERRAVLLEILDSRFGAVPAGVAQQITQEADLTRLRALLPVAATADTLDDFARSLEQPVR